MQFGTPAVVNGTCFGNAPKKAPLFTVYQQFPCQKIKNYAISERNVKNSFLFKVVPKLEEERRIRSSAVK
jgi:hypothetical protein